MTREAQYIQNQDARYDVWLITPEGSSQVGTRLMLTLAFEVASVWTDDPCVCVSVMDAETGYVIAHR